MFVEYVFQVSAFLRPWHHFIDIHVIIDVSLFSSLIFGFMANSQGTLLPYIFSSMFISNHEMNKFVVMIIVNFSLYTCCNIEFIILSHSRHNEGFNNWQNVCSSAYLLRV